jgi:hypothetical protein
MAVSAVDSQDAVIVRLENLLQRARIVKSGTSIDPPLQVSELVPDDEPLLGEIEGEDDNRKLAVDSATKTLFYANLVGPALHYSCIMLIRPGSDPNRRAWLCGHLESARYSAVLRRPRYAQQIHSGVSET